VYPPGWQPGSESSKINRMGEPLPVPPLQLPWSTLPRKRRGYDRRVTEDLFHKISASYEELWVECSWLREQLDALQQETARALEEKRLIADALADVSRSAAAIREEARREAEAILRKARAKADEIADGVERKARAKAAEIVAEAERERAPIEAEVERLRAFARNTHQELSSFLLGAFRRHPATRDGSLAAALEAMLERSPVTEARGRRSRGL
jgi:cell division septum initiation protein DivIVA